MSFRSCLVMCIDSPSGGAVDMIWSTSMPPQSSHCQYLELCKAAPVQLRDSISTRYSQVVTV
jgi:hypothetical protein